MVVYYGEKVIGLFNGSLQATEEGKYQAIGNILLNILLLIFIKLRIFIMVSLCFNFNK